MDSSESPLLSLYSLMKISGIALTLSFLSVYFFGFPRPKSSEFYKTATPKKDQ